LFGLKNQDQQLLILDPDPVTHQKPVFRIRNGLNTDPDPALKVNMNPDPALEVNTDQDPGPGYFMTYISPPIF